MPSAQQTQSKSRSNQKPKTMMDAEDVMIFEMLGQRSRCRGRCRG
jgi:hypothetical protein